MFLAVRVRDKVQQTVLSESALKDATGAICTFAILGVLSTGEFSVGASLQQFAVLAGGGVLIGAVFGLVAVFLKSNRGRNIFTAYAKVLLLPVILGAYLCADYLGTSGFMAVFVVGLIYGNKDASGLSMPGRASRVPKRVHRQQFAAAPDDHLHLLGTHVDFNVVRQYLLPGCAVVAIFMLDRPAACGACVHVARPPRTLDAQRNCSCSGRGKPARYRQRSPYAGRMGVAHSGNAAITFMAILATLLIQATTTRWLAARLGLLEMGKRTG